MAQLEPDLSEFFTLGAMALRARKVKPCQVEGFLKTLSPKDASVLEAALANEKIKPGWIVKWCARRGATGLWPSQICNHRKGVCRCAIGD